VTLRTTTSSVSVIVSVTLLSRSLSVSVPKSKATDWPGLASDARALARTCAKPPST
jgi:hypothetical protein